MSSIKPWCVLKSQPLNDYKIFSTRRDCVVSPRTGETHDVYVLEGASWVNVLALTKERQIVLVQQYRHGLREITWEIPGGVMDDGETPEAGAARELLEETGYQGINARVLGKVHPNPAFQNNVCYTILIEDVQLVRAPRLDGMEDIAVKLTTEEEFGCMIADGRIAHGLVVVADFWRRLWRAGASPRQRMTASDKKGSASMRFFSQRSRRITARRSRNQRTCPPSEGGCSGVPPRR
ncbi:MAG: NUDIX hydrolase, partial [Verrucomicrobia bacterium]|nr:NUDIX hydrolase [Verrucomicrobiota bacterium]